MSREHFGRVQGEAGDAVLEEKLRGGVRTKEEKNDSSGSGSYFR